MSSGFLKAGELLSHDDLDCTRLDLQLELVSDCPTPMQSQDQEALWAFLRDVLSSSPLLSSRVDITKPLTWVHSL